MQEIIEQVLRLKAVERFEVMEKILQSLDKPDPEINRIWGEEALRRVHAYDQGQMKTYSLEETLGDD